MAHENPQPSKWETPGHVNASEAARWLGISRERVSKKLQKGDFPGAYKAGRRWAIPWPIEQRHDRAYHGRKELNSMYAARYTRDWESDVKRGMSYMGFSIKPYETEGECWMNHPSADEAVYVENVSDDVFGLFDGASGYLPAKYGLCAFVGETPEEAIAKARKYEWLLSDSQIIVFPCRIIGEVDDATEEEAGGFRVEPTGEPIARLDA